MATNKHATIRYQALDKCFSNRGRDYFIEDLVESCNKAIYDYSGVMGDVKKRSVQYDIEFMESEQGWSIDLERVKIGRRRIYKYADPKFSINNHIINESEKDQLKGVLAILNKFNGMPQFNWMEDLMLKIDSTINYQDIERPIVLFEQNEFLKGMEYFEKLFSSIENKKVLEIKYNSFKEEPLFTFTVHPYFLKQFNNRWFLFGYGDKEKMILNLPLDRIEDIKISSKRYRENEIEDNANYFEDVIGVTVKDENPVKVLLQINNNTYPYIGSKPIHGSQKVIERTEKSVLVQLNVQINYELISLILSYGEQVVVVEPVSLRNIIRDKVNLLVKNYI